MVEIGRYGRSLPRIEPFRLKPGLLVPYARTAAVSVGATLHLKRRARSAPKETRRQVKSNQSNQTIVCLRSDLHSPPA